VSKAIRKFLGGTIKLIGILLFILVGAYGLFVTWFWLTELFGVFAAIGGIVVYPVTFALFPWYLGIFESQWLLLIINYVGGFLSYLIIHFS